MIKKKNFIIIGSTGRNSGKTEFACKLIKKLSKHDVVIGVKVTTIKDYGEECPRGGQGCGACSTLTGNYILTEEINAVTKKDTARMLQSGAKKVFWLRVLNKSLSEGIGELYKKIPDNVVVVCESNSSRLVIEPGLFIIISNSSDKFIKESCKQVYNYADKIIRFDGKSWDYSHERIWFENNQWGIREKATAQGCCGKKKVSCDKATQST